MISRLQSMNVFMYVVLL